MQVQLELFNSGMIMYDLLWLDDGFGLGLLGGLFHLFVQMGSLSSNVLHIHMSYVICAWMKNSHRCPK